MSTPQIKDIAVVSVYLNNKRPIGEAPGRGEKLAPMSGKSRVEMLDRLFQSVFEKMETAHNIHLKEDKEEGAGAVNLDYITRLSTHEFFFYTQEPLTLEEFELLQNKIAKKAQELPCAIHLILASFAVRVGSQVMNVVPYIICGEVPVFQFLVKNYTSNIDVRYKEKNAEGADIVLKFFDARSKLPLPEIKINGVRHVFTFNNIIHCTTPAGTPFLTAVDICLDHLQGCAKSVIDKLVAAMPHIIEQAISHVVVSNVVDLVPEKIV